jgi:hypothetical protein
MPCIKLASGLFDRAATLPHLNAALEEAEGSGMAIDFTPDKNEDRFVLADAFRLALKVRGTDENLVASVEWR